MAARARGPKTASFGRDVAGHIAACSVIAVLLAIALDRGTSGVTELIVAMLAALASAVIVRRVVQPPALALLGPVARAVSRRGWFRSGPISGARRRSIAVFTAGAALAAPAIRRPHPWVLGGTDRSCCSRSPRSTNATRS